MNASALLKSQGWRGPGHTLHASSDSIGLTKRLAVSRKNQNETKGLGSSQYIQEQWWLTALSEQLSGLESTANGGVVQKVQDGKLNRLGEPGKSQLYKMFVRGGMLEGTVGLVPEESEGGLKAKSQVKAGPKVDGWTQSTLMPIKQDDSEETLSSSDATVTRTETKEERRARREAKRKRKEDRRLRREVRDMEKQKPSAASSDTSETTRSDQRNETKEERRARKEAKRKQREEKRRLSG